MKSHVVGTTITTTNEATEITTTTKVRVVIQVKGLEQGQQRLISKAG